MDQLGRAGALVEIVDVLGDQQERAVPTPLQLRQRRVRRVGPDRRVEQAAAADGIERLDLSASLPALEFYLRLGYEIVSEEDYEVAPGQHLEYYEMAKQIAPIGG